MLEPTKEPEIHVTLDVDGSVEVEVHHVKGPACTALSRPYDSLFNVTATQTKAAFHEPTTTTVKQPAKL